jgi:hypothetical protein
VETTSTPLGVRRRAIIVGQSDVEGTARSCHRQGGGQGRSLMGEMVPRCGTMSLMRIIVLERSVCGSERKKDTTSLRSVRG